MNQTLTLRTRLILRIGVTCVCASAIDISAQDLAVQQPVVQQFRVDTSVSVPDQGQAHLGGVMRAADGRKIYGPVPNGSSGGRELSHSYQTVSVQILDFEEMDEAILAAARERKVNSLRTRISPLKTARTGVEPAKPMRNRMAEHAWKSLEMRANRH